MTLQSNGRSLTKQQKNIGLVALITSTTIALTGQFLISPILVFQLNRRGISAANIGLFTSSGWLGILLTTPFAAAVSTRIGIKPVLLVSLAVPLVGMAGIMLTDSIAVWLALYFLIGFGSALRWIVGEALIADLAEPALRGRIVGTFQMLLGAAFVAAPSLLAWLGPMNTDAQWMSLTLLACGLGLTLLMPKIDSSQEMGHPVGIKALAKIARTSPLVISAGFIGGFFELGISSVLPVYGMAIGFSAAMAALLIAISGVGSSVVMLPVGMAADHFGPARPMVGCAVALVLSSAVLPLAVYEPRLAWPAAMTWGAAGGALYTLTMINIGHHTRGSALINSTSLLVLSYTLGGLAGPMLTGIAIELSIRWAISVLYLVISLIGLWVLTRHRFWVRQ